MVNKSVLDPVTQQTLPVATGGTAIKRDMTEANTELTELIASSRADTLYDPAPPLPISPTKTVSGFCNNTSPIFFAAGVLLIIFAFIKTK